MKSIKHENSNCNQNLLSIDHNITDFKFYSHCHLCSKFKVDENEKKFLDFVNSKLEAMEKINLDDECLLEDQIETRKINTDKKKLTKKEFSKRKKYSNSVKKIKNKKNNSRKTSKNESNNKNMIVNHNGKVEKPKTENIDLVDVINFDVDKEIKEKELRKFFSSDKTLLNSIINEMKEK